MSREIKLRAWRPYDKRMAHFEPGFAWHDEYNLWYLSQIQQEHDKEITDVPCGDNIVLMQYTGLKDKNGKGIYEGDILRSSSCLPEDTGEYEVRFENGAFHLFWTTGSWHCGFSQEEIDALNLEIIGNIYETPELIKENLSAQ